MQSLYWMDCIEVAQERSFDAGSQRTDCGWWLLHVSELRWLACQVPLGSLLGWDSLKKGNLGTGPNSSFPSGVDQLAIIIPITSKF
jgi:hypothetical protein